MDAPLVIQASGPDYDGFLVIDSVHHNRSAGGVRIAPDLAVDEVRSLAREMTLKYSLFRLPRGGAKAGLRLAGDLPPERRRRALEGFGRQLGPIIRAGLYNPGMDMNCGPEDLVTLYGGAGVHIGPPTDTSFHTAFTAANALLGCAEALDPEASFTVAVAGFGSVGKHLAAMLPPSRMRVVALSTVAGAVSRSEGFTPEELHRKRSEHGDELVHTLEGDRIPPEEVLTTQVDFLVPAARTGMLTEDLARRLRARAVVPVANAPYRGRAAAILHERGVVCLPGYLCNAGGVFGSSLADSGVPVPDIEELFRTRYRPLVRLLVERCRAAGLSAVDAVDSLAAEEAERRAVIRPPDSLAAKIAQRAARRLPRAMKRRTMETRCRRALDAMEADFRGVGA